MGIYRALETQMSDITGPKRISKQGRIVMVTHKKGVEIFVIGINGQKLYKDYREAYQVYLKSKQWKTVRRQVLKRDNYTCQGCGLPANLAHHLNYYSLGKQEETNSCISLCWNCHEKRHDIDRT